MPFKITNNPGRPRPARPHRLNSGGSSSIPAPVNPGVTTPEDSVVLAESGIVADKGTGTLSEEPEPDHADHSSLHSGSEETACSPVSTVRDPNVELKSSDITYGKGKATTPHQPHDDFPHKNHVRSHSRQRHSSERDDQDVQTARASISLRSADLAHALGTDNVRFTTEIENIPCAGIRIEFGPLAGLLAWRLVVRPPLPVAAKQKRGWWGASGSQPNIQPAIGEHVQALQDCIDDLPPAIPEKLGHLRSSRSVASLPLPHTQGGNKKVLDTHHRQRSVAQHPLALGSLSSEAIVTNFILDTSSPFSIISRETLVALGFSSSDIPLSHNLHSSPFHTETDPVVTLSVQNVRTQFRIAREGEAGRLGVQFMQDANVSLFFPREHGIGPVLYYDSARPPLHGIPATVSLSSHYHNNSARLSLPQRIKLLFGIA